MQKTLIKAVLAATLFTTGLIATAKQPTVHADVNHTVHLYHFKKVGKHYVVKKKYPEMIFKNLKHTGKAITYHGTKYYYNPLYQGYLASDKYHLSFKKHAHKHATNNDTNTDNNNHDNNTGTNNTSNHQDNQNSDQIVDGFDETTSTVVDQNAYINAFKNYMIQDINNYRQSQGLQPLTLDTGKLEDVAMTRAQQVFTNPVHVDSNGNIIVKQMLQNAGINYSMQSENIISGGLTESEYFANAKDSADGVLQNWLDEKNDNGGHYQNLVNPTAKSVGIGIYIGPNNGLRTQAGYVEDYIG